MTLTAADLTARLNAGRTITVPTPAAKPEADVKASAAASTKRRKTTSKPQPQPEAAVNTSPTVTDPNRWATRKQRGYIAGLSGSKYYAGSDLTRGMASQIITALKAGETATLPDGTVLTVAADAA